MWSMIYAPLNMLNDDVLLLLELTDEWESNHECERNLVTMSHEISIWKVENSGEVKENMKNKVKKTWKIKNSKSTKIMEQ